jgi:UDP-N-acetylglucosamine--N-acetylmuramyl-(pentapeptide) pyrophosphoryl-undecaprenol N-acetylglucosamine transferase
MRFEALARLGNRFIPVPAAPLYRKRIWKNFRSIWVFLKGFLRGRALLRGLKPDAVVGMGGYATGALLLASRMGHVPYLLCEQNAVPGFANRLFCKRARCLLVSYAAVIDRFPKRIRPRCLVTGNPVREAFGKTGRAEARAAFSLKKVSGPVLGVVGGSQGAAGINGAVLGLLDRLRKKKVSVIWSTGPRAHERIAAQAARPGVQVFPFVERMDCFLGAVDLIISRAGATSLAEIAASGTASVLVPYPHAAADHQTRNAQAFVEAGAAVMVGEGEGFAERLAETIFGLLDDERRLQTLRKAASRLHKSDTVRLMADAVEKTREPADASI